MLWLGLLAACCHWTAAAVAGMTVTNGVTASQPTAVLDTDEAVLDEMSPDTLELLALRREQNLATAPDNAESLEREKERERGGFKFAHFTDTHFYPEAMRNYGFCIGGSFERCEQQQMASHQLVDTLFQELKAAQPDLAVHTGDIACGGEAFGLSSEQFQKHMQMFRDREHRELPFAVYHTPGNHDSDPHRMHLEVWQKHFAGNDQTSYHAFDHKGWRFILLDTASANDAGERHSQNGEGVLHAKQQQWLHGQLQDARTKGMKALLFSHNWLHGASAGMGVKYADKVLERVDSFSDVVVAHFSGHEHKHAVNKRNSIDFYGTSAVIEAPMKWREVHVGHDSIQVVDKQLPLPKLVDQSLEAQKAASLAMASGDLERGEEAMYK